MNKRLFVLATLLFTGCLIFTMSLYAGNAFQDEMKLSDTSYPHTKGEVAFSHKKHADAYHVGCGECHHDKDGKPLAALKVGDNVQRCVECHKKPGEMKSQAGEKVEDKVKREHHANALHDNCIGCHKDHNKKTDTKNAPVVCTKCHAKK